MELFHKTLGQGPPLIILHGFLGTSDNWQTLGRRWAEHYTVVLPDQRNHGRSPDAVEHNYPALAEDIKAFMENHWMYKAHILGHSMGGKVAMQLALQYPDLVDKLVVVDIAPKAYPGGHETILEALNSLDLNTLEDRDQANAHLAKYIEEDGIRQFLLKNLTRNKEGGYVWKMNLPILTQDYPDILTNIEEGTPFTGDALFLRGGNSRYVQDADWPEIQRRFPNAQLATIPNAGHWVHAEQPGLLYQAVSDFLMA